MEGFLLIDKPSGWTSHDVVGKLRRITGVRRIGHAGTLDPFATGLLIVGVGRGATKRLGEFLGQSKTYEAVAVLGATSDTQDLTGKIEGRRTTGPQDGGWPDEATVRAAMQKFLGPIQQTPPMYSAKKIAGQKLYELARKGKVVERKPVEVTIYEFELLRYDIPPTDSNPADPMALWPCGPRLKFRTRASSGTYVRTLAHDLGAALGCGAYLEELRRTSIGACRIEDANKIDDVTPENWESLLTQLPPA